MKLNEIYQIYKTPQIPPFKEVLDDMADSRAVDFGIEFDISSLHSDPEIAKKLADRAGSKLPAAISRNEITLTISLRSSSVTALLNLVYDVAAGKMHGKLDNTHSFDIDIKRLGYATFNIVMELQDECIEWLENKASN